MIEADMPRRRCCLRCSSSATWVASVGLVDGGGGIGVGGTTGGIIAFISAALSGFGISNFGIGGGGGSTSGFGFGTLTGFGAFGAPPPK
jgi:hypothetical protein